VVELSKEVLNEKRFMKANPGYIVGKPCVYVGMTGLNPDLRFDKHKAGIQANRYVLQFGLRLLPEIYEAYNPMSYDDARDMEVELAIDLREGGYGVGRRKSRQPSPVARTIRSNPATTTTAPMARATRSPAGARRSTVMAAVTSAITPRSMTPMTRRIAIRPAQQRLQWRPRRRPCRHAAPASPAACGLARASPDNRRADVPSTR
jgi:hypothetical protein